LRSRLNPNSVIGENCATSLRIFETMNDANNREVVAYIDTAVAQQAALSAAEPLDRIVRAVPGRRP
jgi:hypothetical protein